MTDLSENAEDRVVPATRERLDVRQLARSIALLCCAAVGVYLVTTIALARLALALAEHAQRLGSPALALAGAALVDLGKLVGLLPAAWVIRRAVAFRPLVAASVLVALCFALELIVMVLVQQARWSWDRPAIWGTRLAVALVLVLPVAWVMSRGRSVTRPIS